MNGIIFNINHDQKMINDIVRIYNARQEARFMDSDSPVSLIREGEIMIQRFSDNEITTQFQTSVRDRNVFLVCSTSDSDSIMMLALAIDAARRASARKVILVLPYYGYSRQDRRDGYRGAIGAKVVANILTMNGNVDGIISVDLHANQIEGYFNNTPVEHIAGVEVLFDDLSEYIEKDELISICSPDSGGVKRAQKFFNLLLEDHEITNLNMVTMAKIRDKANSVGEMYLMGDVENRHVIIVDDMVDTAGTLMKASKILKENGAKKITVVFTHPVLSGKAYDNLYKSDIDTIITTNSLLMDEKGFEKLSKKKTVRVVSLSNILAKYIEIVNQGISRSKLIEEHKYSK